MHGVRLNYPDIGSGEVGPFIFPLQADTVAAQLAEAVAGGARILAGGSVETLGGGKYLRPTVLTDVTADMRIVRDEASATIDHVQSFHSGGAETTENFYTACTKCNYRKSDLEVATFIERNKQKKVVARYGEPTSWDGLVSVFTALAIRHPKGLISSDRKWIEALR